MFSPSSLLLMLMSASLVFTLPAGHAQNQARQSSTQCVSGRLYQPELFNIYQYPNVVPFQASARVVNIMSGSSSGSVQDQVARWQVPTSAKSCTLGWGMAAERSFSVYDNGLVRFRQMTGLPTSNITVDTIQPFIPAVSPSGSMDFTFWPEVLGPRLSTGGPLTCAGEVIVHLSKDVVDGGKGSVMLEQDAQNGLYLEITC